MSWRKDFFEEDIVRPKRIVKPQSCSLVTMSLFYTHDYKKFKSRHDLRRTTIVTSKLGHSFFGLKAGPD